MNKALMFRTGAGLTQEEMAKALGMSKPTYKSREDGNSEWKLNEMISFVNKINSVTNSCYKIEDIFLN